MRKLRLRIPHFAGKLVGAVLGYLYADESGAAFGIILGHSFDFYRKSLLAYALTFLRKLKSLPLPKPKEKIYRQTLFFSLGFVARQEGRVTPQSIAAAEALFKRLKLNQQEREQAISQFNAGKLAPNVNAQIDLFSRRYASKKNKRLSFLKQLLNLAYAGQPATSTQILSITSLLPFLNLNTDDFNLIHQQVRIDKGLETAEAEAEQTASFTSVSTPELKAAYATLQVPLSADLSAVKLSYRKLMSQNHPDKLVAQGLSERALEQAKNATQEIQQAYALIKRNLQTQS